MQLRNQLVTPAWKWLFPLLIFGIILIVYSNTFSAAFIFDDHMVIVNNKDIRHILPLKIQSRCVVDLLFKLNYAVGGLNVAYYHAVNIIIHVCAALFLYGFVRRVCLLPSMAARYGRAASWLALITSIIWAVHPLQTESVTYLCQRYESMMGMFFLGVLYCFVRSAESSRKRLWYDLTILACAIGMGTKEVMVAAPVVVAVFDWLFLSSSVREMLQNRWKFHAAMFSSIGIVVLLTIRQLSLAVQTGHPAFTVMSPLTYAVTQLEVVTHYLRLSFWPACLCLDYMWPPSESFLKVLFPSGILIGGLLMTTLVALFRKWPSSFPGILFFVVLAPTSSFLPRPDMAFEHRMYLPLAGVVVFVVCGLYSVNQWLCGRYKRCQRGVRAAGVLMALFVISSLSVITIQRNTIYGTAESLWRDVVGKRPRNVRALGNLVRELLHNQKNAEAERVSVLLLNCIEAEKRPSDSLYVVSPGLLMHFQASAQDRLGVALLCAGRTEESIAHFLEAVRISPRDGYARHNLSLALILSGKTNEALGELESVQQEDEGRERCQSLLAFILAGKGDFAGAVRCYRNALEIDSSNLSDKCELAWILATSPDNKIRNGADALMLAKEAVEASFHASYHALDVLAAAYAENRMFDEAQKTAVMARMIAIKRKQEKKNESVTPGALQKVEDIDVTVSDIEGRIRLYEQKKPYRVKASAL